jgi:hypothetical protein
MKLNIKEKVKPGKGYDVKKSLGKFWDGLGYTLILAMITSAIAYLNTVDNLSPEMIIWIGLGVAVLAGLKNALTHWHDTKDD